jgi:hypothetical protein
MPRASARRDADELLVRFPRPPQAPKIEAKEGQEYECVVPGELSGQRDDERIESRNGEETDIDPLMRFDLEGRVTTSLRQKEHQSNDRPSQPEQKSVGSGHVRCSIRAVRGPMPGRIGEEQVDCVLRKHRHQSDRRDGDATRDVDPSRVRGPRQQNR